jgi:hypothetical protein
MKVRTWHTALAALLLGGMAVVWFASDAFQRDPAALAPPARSSAAGSPDEPPTTQRSFAVDRDASVARQAEAAPELAAASVERGPGVLVHVRDREGRGLEDVSVALNVPPAIALPELRLPMEQAQSSAPQHHPEGNLRLRGLFVSEWGDHRMTNAAEWEAPASSWDLGIIEQVRARSPLRVTILREGRTFPITESSVGRSSGETLTRRRTDEHGEAWFPMQGVLHSALSTESTALEAELEVPGASARRQTFQCQRGQTVELAFELRAPRRVSLAIPAAEIGRTTEVALRWHEVDEQHPRAIGPEFYLRSGERCEAWADGVCPTVLIARAKEALAPPLRLELSAQELEGLHEIDVWSRLAHVQLLLLDSDGSPCGSQSFRAGISGEDWQANDLRTTDPEGQLELWIDASSELQHRRLLSLQRERTAPSNHSYAEEEVHIDVSGVLGGRGPIDLGTHQLGSHLRIVEGRVLDDDGRGVPDALISAAERSESTRSDALGHFRLRCSMLDPERLLWAEKAGYCQREATRARVPSAGIELRLALCGGIEGTVRGPAELVHDLRFVAVFATSVAADRLWVRSTSLAPGGAFELSSLPRGPGRLWFGYQGLPLLELPVQIGEQPTQLGEIDLESEIQSFELAVQRADPADARALAVELCLKDGDTHLGTGRSTATSYRHVRFWIPRRAKHWSATCAGESRSGSIADGPPAPWILPR